MPATLMSMPKTAIHKDDCPVTRQYYIGRPREPPVVDPETEPLRVKEPADSYLRPGILTLYRRHASAPLLRGHSISHKGLFLVHQTHKNTALTHHLSSEQRESGRREHVFTLEVGLCHGEHHHTLYQRKDSP